MRTASVIGGFLLASFVLLPALAAKDKKQKAQELSPLDQYLEDARRAGTVTGPSSAPGSLWSPGARFYDIAADLRANRLNDIVTVLVQERASADSQGTVTSARSSNANSSIGAFGGIPSKAGALQNLFGVNSDSSLEGKGGTTRRTVLTATIATRVIEVLPNGNLVLEGQKKVVVNSEHQIILVRGVARPYDISVANTISSDQIAQLELKVDGKGVVGDAVRRPNFFYRLLLGLLPF